MSVFSLYQLLESRKFSQLPRLLQEVITDDEERRDMFQEKFLDYDDKDRWVCIKSAMDTCLEKALFQERAFYHVLFLQEVRGETVDDEWTDMIMDQCEDDEKVCASTQTEPIAIQTEEPAQEVNVPTTDVEPPKRRIRRKYNCADFTYRCSCCKVNLASDGALHNHYKSRLHTKGVKKMLVALREIVKIEDKLIVDVRNKAFDPELSWEISDQEELDGVMNDVEKYIEKGHDKNPITDLYLRRPFKRVLASGEERITWTPVNVLQSTILKS